MQAARHRRKAVDEVERMTTIRILRQGQVIASASGERAASLLYRGTYQPGDEIRFEAGYSRARVTVDQAVAPARVFIENGGFTYRVPIGGDSALVYAPGAFAGDVHLIDIRPDELNSYRNIAENPADQRGETSAYPHATANVETRGESVFAARNVIDGLHIADGHGAWPYGSWGIGERTDAELTLDFGREVEVNTMVLWLRADFPHDAYWVCGAVTLSDGTRIDFPLLGIDGPQRVELGTHTIRYLKLHSLVKCDKPSAFPALRQLEVFGRDVRTDS